MSNQLKLLILVSAVILASLLQVSDCLAIYGPIASDTTWSDTVHITGDIIVLDGVVLRITPGSVVDISDECVWDTINGKDNMCDIIVYGVLNASGTLSDSINFTCLDPDFLSRGWGFLKFDNTDDTCTIKYANISYSYGIHFLSSFSLLYNNTFLNNSHISKNEYICIENSSCVRIENNTVLHSSYAWLGATIYVIYAYSVKIENNTIYGNWADYAIHVENSSSISIHSNDIYSRIVKIKIEDCTVATVSKNIVGSTDNPSKSRNYPFSNRPNRSWYLNSSGIAVVGSRIRVYDNIILNSYGYTSLDGSTTGTGISCSGSCIEIDNNIITNCVGGDGGYDDMGFPFSGSPGYGISCTYCDSCIIISSNIVSRCFGGSHFASAPGGDGIGIYCKWSSPILFGNLISDCMGGSNAPTGGIGILIKGRGSPVIGGAIESQNDIIDNTDYNIMNFTSNDIIATYSWWGTADSLEIAAMIHDFYNDPLLGIVYFSPWADSAVYGIDETVRDSLSNPSEFVLFHNSPNPFVYRTSIAYIIPNETHISIKIYDVAGRMIKTLVNRKVGPGYYTVQWDARDASNLRVAAGVYFYRLESTDFTKTRKMVVIGK